MPAPLETNETPLYRPYPVTATLSLDAIHETVIEVVAVAVTAKLVGVEGACVSAGGQGLVELVRVDFGERLPAVS